ncbi:MULTISPECIES: hypothetical protein [Paraburkholderia]|nr:hypothetical protein [Paraburkholderia fungorum]
MQQGGAQRRPAGIDTNLSTRSTFMIQMMMATIGAPAARGAQQRHALTWRKAMGFAIVASGLAVVVMQALQHALGG